MESAVALYNPKTQTILHYQRIFRNTAVLNWKNNTKPSDRESGRQPRTVSDGFYKMLIYEWLPTYEDPLS